MARVKAGVFGNAYSGKAGNMVFSTLNGEQIVRAYQPNVTNPQTPLQTAQRSRFSLAVEIAKELKLRISQMYGVEKLQGFGSICKLMLNSPLVKAYNGLSNKLTGVAEAVIFKSGELKSSGNLIQTYDAEGLNIFEFGVTLGFRNPGSIPSGLTKGHFPLICTLLIDGVFAVPTERKVFFGCDYQLGSDIRIAYLDKNAQSVTSAPSLHISNPNDLEGIIDVKVVSNSQGIGAKNRGFFSNPESCGKGWKYVYECDLCEAGWDIVHFQHSMYGDYANRYDNFLPSLTFAAFTNRSEVNATIIPLTMFNAISFNDAIGINQH